MKIKIEKGVAMPAAIRGTSKYPLAEMNVGESFFMAETGREGLRLLVNKLSGACTHYRLKHEPKTRWSIRQVKGGVRVWRMK